jgi:hypothetical protein
LYADFYNSNTIATFKVTSGCKLEFVGDTSAVGLNGGSVDGMALHGDILVVAYADGSIESFNVSKGIAVSNGDEQFSTGSKHDGGTPTGVDISSDGHYAIFGDATPRVYVEVEVSDIFSGKLAPTVEYGGPGKHFGSEDSQVVRLSPDESLIYLSGGRIPARFRRAANRKRSGDTRYTSWAPEATPRNSLSGSAKCCGWRKSAEAMACRRQ